MTLISGVLGIQCADGRGDFVRREAVTNSTFLGDHTLGSCINVCCVVIIAYKVIHETLVSSFVGLTRHQHHSFAYKVKTRAKQFRNCIDGSAFND